jgi:large subunit ribosomal protein L5
MSAKKKSAEGSTAVAERPPRPATPRLKARYEKEVLPALAQKLGRKNRLSLPRLEKIVVNMGVGAAISEKKYMEEAVGALTQITGQKPLLTRSRKSIAGFRLREGMEIGCKVTLRGLRMWEFMDRLISLALPRVRLVFPELNPDKYTRVQGMNVTFVISTDKDDESRELLRLLGMPFKTEETASGKGGANATAR